MSDQDPFETAAPPADDPFGSTVTVDAADEVAAEPTPDEPATDLPVVDREGEPVADSEADAIEAAAETPPAVADDAGSTPPPVEDAPEAPEEPQEPQEPQEEPQVPEEEPQEPQAPAVVAEEAVIEAVEPLEAPEQPEANGPRGGKGEMRRYKLLYLTAPSQWTEFDLSSVDQESTGAKIERDAEGEHWMLARNNEHANRIAFAVLGRPKEGVFAFPIPRGSWKPKRVKPAAPRPERERLEIS